MEFMLNNVSMAFDIRFDSGKVQLPERVKVLEGTHNYPLGIGFITKTMDICRYNITNYKKNRNNNETF